MIPVRPRQAHVLLVEDSPSDRLIMTRAIRDAGLPWQVHAVETGLEGLRFLNRDEPYADAPTPDLILLDLNMPVLDGREFLARVKKDARFLRIPIVVLTTSASPDDIRASYDAHANSYVTKPLDFDEFGEMLRTLEEHWFALVSLSDSED